jgi:hypothetical protein
MSVSYNIRLMDANGVPVASLNDYESLDVVLVENGVGALSLVLPFGRLPLDTFQKDGRIAVERSVGGRAPALLGDALWLVRRRRRRVAQNGERTIEITALHANCLLSRRIIAYYSGTAYTAKTAAADNLLKAFARQNLGSGIVTADRIGAETYADLSSVLTIEADTGLGPSISKAAAYDNLLSTCQAIADASAQAGTYLGFEVCSLDGAMLTLRTYTTLRGADHRFGSAAPILIGPAYGNVGEYDLDEDWREEATWVLAGGQGELSTRTTGTSSNDALAAESPLGRSERFVYATDTSDAGTLADVADANLRRYRPRTLLDAQLLDTAGVQFGLHVGWGDLVTVDVDGEQFDCRVDPVRLTVDRQGERRTIRLRGTT